MVALLVLPGTCISAASPVAEIPNADRASDFHLPIRCCILFMYEALQSLCPVISHTLGQELLAVTKLCGSAPLAGEQCSIAELQNDCLYIGNCHKMSAQSEADESAGLCGLGIRGPDMDFLCPCKNCQTRTPVHLQHADRPVVLLFFFTVPV